MSMAIMKSIPAMILFGVLPLNSALASTPIPILGLQLGGKFPEIKNCYNRQSESEEKLCWANRPSLYDGGKYGDIKLPGSDSRPRWAANASFSVSLSKSNTLNTLTVRTPLYTFRDEVIRSIESRFGPTTKEYNSPGRSQSAYWEKSPVTIRMTCTVKAGCEVVFTSLEYAQELKTVAERRKAKDDARPVGP
jgi:hypothetical protein